MFTNQEKKINSWFYASTLHLLFYLFLKDKTLGIYQLKLVPSILSRGYGYKYDPATAFDKMIVKMESKRW